VNINAYKGSDGEYHANLAFHTNYIDIIASGKIKAGTAAVPAAAGAPETVDDLPF
jgi:hypothetical protein